MKIVAFNGPPRCGKDTCADLLKDYIENRTDRPVYRRALSMPLRLMVFGALQRPYEQAEFERLKDEIIPSLGVTMRQFQIDISEHLMKPAYRHDIFPLLMLESIPSNGQAKEPLIIISDMGFPIEVGSLSLMLGADNLLVVQVKREGCTFANDSRGYVRHEQMVEIVNDSDIESLNHDITQLAEHANRLWNL